MQVHTGSTPLAIAACGALLLAACAPAAHRPGGPRTGGRMGIVVNAAQMDVRGANLLGALQGHVPGMGVRHPVNASCPAITLRGPKSLVGSNDPLVYVDGTRAINTCVLEMLSAADVQRVEVYPAGIAAQPGYDFSANGLILVFLQTGADDGAPETTTGE
ncbi:MAG TPA: TonB-dependent receptor plug domain-containing protein [Longimicrobiaceae bacterium]|jgi:hypothetical protein|nr:TonB-dependent receptor plug domain-containing protein [Longimicrobiaceae bacterium]